MPRAQPLGVEQEAEARQVLLARAAGQHVVVGPPERDLVERRRQPPGLGFRGIGVPAGEARAQFLQRRRQQEDIAMGAADRLILQHAQLRGPLHVEVEQHVLAALEKGQHFAAGRAVAAAEDLGMFEEIAGFDLGDEFLLRQEMIIAAIRLAGTRCAGRRGDAVMARAVGAGGAAEGGLAAAGRAGHDAEEAGAAGGNRRCDHSMFCTCSRNFSTSHFPATTRCAMAASLALAPVVLSSRCSSWQRKSSGRPAGLPALSTLSH